MKRLPYWRNCVSTPPEEVPALSQMIRDGVAVTRDTFVRHVVLSDLVAMEAELGYERKSQYLTMPKDFMVGYFRSTWDGWPCYYFTWSAIEHYFVAPEGRGPIMPYTISIMDSNSPTLAHGWLTEALQASRFKARLEVNAGDIEVTAVRLKRAKPYCGQHPGPCQLGGPRRSGTWLEWDDWVEFNGLVNDVLDKHSVSALVFSLPQEALDKGKQMVVRRGLKRRHKYDWHEGVWRGRSGIRIWNHGTPDQFEN